MDIYPCEVSQNHQNTPKNQSSANHSHGTGAAGCGFGTTMYEEYACHITFSSIHGGLHKVELKFRVGVGTLPKFWSKMSKIPIYIVFDTNFKYNIKCSFKKIFFFPQTQFDPKKAFLAILRPFSYDVRVTFRTIYEEVVWRKVKKEGKLN